MVMADYKSPALISDWAAQTRQRCASRRKPNGQDVEIKEPGGHINSFEPEFEDKHKHECAVCCIF